MFQCKSFEQAKRIADALRSDGTDAGYHASVHYLKGYHRRNQIEYAVVKEQDPAERLKKYQ